MEGQRLWGSTYIDDDGYDLNLKTCVPESGGIRQVMTGQGLSFNGWGGKQGHRVRLEGETLRATQAGYFGLIEQLDDQVAPLIADFKARSEKASRSWVIVVTSDHGEMLGDHGFFRKCEPFDGTEYLFNLDHDSHEEHDLARVVAQRELLERCRARLIQRLAMRPEGFYGHSGDRDARSQFGCAELLSNH